MLRITTLKGNVSATAKTYYSKEDNYYHQEATTFWHGNLANELNLIGEVDTETFENMLNGILPSGEQAISNKRTKDSQRRMGYDFTFSASKSISIQGLIANDMKIIKAHDIAVKNALNELEKHVSARKRIGNDRVKEVTNNFAVATFRHELSRSLDPQIHTHAIVMNMTKREDGAFCAIANENLFKLTKEIDAIYKNELLKQLYTLGYDIRFTGKNGEFELAHISRKQIELFSKRMLQIQEQSIKHRGKQYDSLSAKEQRIIAEKSRDKKTKVDHTKLRQQWEHTLKENNINLAINLNPAYENNSKLEQQILDNKQNLLFKIVDWAINHHIERQSVIKKSDLIVSSIHQSQGKVSYLEITNYIDDLIEKGVILKSEPLYAVYGDKTNIYKTKETYIDELIKQTNVNLEKANSYFDNALASGQLIEKDIILTTPKAIENENKILAIEKFGRNKVKFISKNHNLNDTNLNPSQKNAVQAIFKQF